MKALDVEVKIRQRAPQRPWQDHVAHILIDRFGVHLYNVDDSLSLIAAEVAGALGPIVERHIIDSLTEPSEAGKLE